MKKTIIAVSILLASVTCFGQKPVKVTELVNGKPVLEELKKDTLSIPADSIAFISTVNMVQFIDYLKKNVSYEGYQKLTPDMVIAELYKYGIVEWNKKKKV